VSLALFLGAVLATTTDAYYIGLKKDGESVSLHRSLEVDSETTELLRKFDNLGRGENNFRDKHGFPDEPLEDFLCPTVAAICSAKNPDLNPTIKKNRCISFLGTIEEYGLRGELSRFAPSM
jgi:hypothetical protein